MGCSIDDKIGFYFIKITVKSKYMNIRLELMNPFPWQQRHRRNNEDSDLSFKKWNDKIGL